LEVGELVGEEWISPRYCKMKVPGFNAFVAKRPDWPHAGWDAEEIEMILTREQGPLGVFDGRSWASLGRVRSDERWEVVSVWEYVGVVRYGKFAGQFLGFDIFTH
jgi:hypothetical protein